MPVILVISEQTTGKLIQKYLEKGNTEVMLCEYDAFERFPAGNVDVVVFDASEHLDNAVSYLRIVQLRTHSRACVMIRSMEQDVTDVENLAAEIGMHLIPIAKPIKLAELQDIVQRQFAGGIPEGAAN